MAATIIDGKDVAARVRVEIAREVAQFEERAGRAPCLATVLVGDDPASHTYIAGKKRASAEVGIRSLHTELPADITQADLMERVSLLALDPEVDGILVQAPLPGGLDEKAVFNAIPPDKDVDGFHPISIGRLALGEPSLPTCTPAGVMRLLDEYEVPLEGADVVVVGRSTTVGKPLALMLLARHASVTICHSRTRDLGAHTRRADVVVMAVGVAELLKGDMVRPGATVIDVGITRTESGLVGDVAFDEVAAVAGLITPVPGGVGPMTIAMLLQNTLDAARRRLEIKAG